MAQALRRSIGSLLLRRAPQAPQQQVLPKRAFSASPAPLSDAAAQHEDFEEALKWRNITVVGYVTCTLLGVYNFVGGHHDEEEERKEYSYLHIRNKEFPWGPDGLFEYTHEEH